MSNQQPEYLTPNQRLHPVKPSRNPYLIKNDGSKVVFRTPLWRTFLFLFLGGAWLAIYLTCAINLGMQGYQNWVVQYNNVDGFVHQIIFLVIVGLLFLWITGLCVLASGATKIAFDLPRRAYRQVLLASPPVFGKRNPDTTGWGNPFVRRVIRGQMDDDLKGVQIVEREDKSQRIYSVYVVPKASSISPCVVYYCNTLQDAQMQLQAIAALLVLPVLETRMMDDTSSSKRKENALLPGDVSIGRKWANIHYGVYWAQRDEAEIIFAMPSIRRREIFVFTGFFLFISLLCVGMGIYCTVIQDPKVDFGSWCFPAVGSLAIASAAFTFTGINRITFDLRQRTYERVLYHPLVIGSVTDYAGLGNRFRRVDLSGTMEEIAGIALHGRPGKQAMTYTILLRWVDNRQLPMGIGFFADRREALEQASEVAMNLSLPILGTNEK